ncbi:hypothetical protein B0J18DRAFT_416523 [Chaetomium sp. MPI-SDFR-AT-0129]|nr:hypothetical protein B0J18DRAFT_416523 [Chaetomium sp. MPI-SDFR-AT-0129]
MLAKLTLSLLLGSRAEHYEFWVLMSICWGFRVRGHRQLGNDEVFFNGEKNMQSSMKHIIKERIDLKRKLTVIKGFLDQALS